MHVQVCFSLRVSVSCRALRAVLCCAACCLPDVRIDQLNKPENIIAGFAPELFGRPLDEEDVLRQDVIKKDDVTYYEW